MLNDAEWIQPIKVMTSVRESRAAFKVDECTVEPLIYDPPHERPPAIYDHISCNGW